MFPMLIGLLSCTLIITNHFFNPALAIRNVQNTETLDVEQVSKVLGQAIYREEERLLSQFPYPIPEEPPLDARLEAVRGLTANEIANLINRDYSGWQDSLPNCPCVESDISQPGSGFVESSWWARRYRNIVDYHPGGDADYRQTEATIREFTSPSNPNAVPIRPGQQCIYDSNGLLINHGPGAGTPDIFGPEGTGVGWGFHTNWDVEPFEAMVGDSTSEIRSNTQGLREYHQTWKPNVGRSSSGELCPMNPEPPRAGIYNAGSRYITIMHQGNRACYQGVSVPPGRYSVAVGETTGSISYSYDNDAFTIDGWQQYGTTVTLGQQLPNPALVVTHGQGEWSTEYEFFNSIDSLTEPMSRCLDSTDVFFEAAPGYQINR